MKNQHLFALGLAALIGAPVFARADDKPIAPDKKSEMKPGKPPKDGMPGHEGMPDHPGPPGHPGMPDHAGMPGMRDGRAMPGARAEERDGGAPGHQAYKNALRELYQDLKDGKLKKDALKVKLAQLNDTRGERGKAHREEVGKRWGATLAMPPARNELKVHARRMAFLDRALVLAEAEPRPDKDKTIDRISKLIDKENARHDQAMARFQSQPAAVPSTTASAAGSVAAGGSQ